MGRFAARARVSLAGDRGLEQIIYAEVRALAGALQRGLALGDLGDSSSIWVTIRCCSERRICISVNVRIYISAQARNGDALI